MLEKSKEADLSQEMKEAWIGFLITYNRVFRKMSDEVREAGAVPPEIYDVLLALEDAPGRRLKMTDISARTVLSPSGVTRLIDRMVRLGYVQREQHDADRRCTWAILTEEGYIARVKSWPAHRKAILNCFAKHITHEEAAVLVKIWENFGDFPRFNEPN